MAGPPRDPDMSDDAATPRWVYVTGTVLIVLALLFVVMHLSGGGIPAH